MTWLDDLPNDYSAFDGLESVTLTPLADGATPISGVQALRHTERQSPLAPLAGPLAMEPREAIFSLFTATLADAIPGCGDTITDAAADIWTITASERLTLGSRWRVTCRRQVA